MRRLLKGILLLAAMSVLITTPALAWIVHQNGIANVSLTVRRAEASWELMEIELGAINSGANFSEYGITPLTVENAETLYVSFRVVTVTDEEKAALAGLWVSIGEDTNGDGKIDVMWGTIETLPVPVPFPEPYPLSPGVYNVVVLVAGIAGYPDIETPIGFTIEGTCEATPITLP